MYFTYYFWLEFGEAKCFIWSPVGSNDYAISTNDNKLKMFKNFNFINEVKLQFDILEIFSGYLLGVKSLGVIAFYDWNNINYIIQIIGDVNFVSWSESGKHLVVVMENSFFLLRYNR